MPTTQNTTNDHHPLNKAIARGLRRHCGVGEGSHILVAVSGGADSVALLRALYALRDRRRWRLALTVGHVQHHLRGDQAEDDARFVAALTQQLKMPQLRKDLDLSDIPGNVEAAARHERYRALRDMAHECGAQFIATAHHADDQLETLLMRLLRGAGTKGMSGIGYRRNMGTGNRDQESGEQQDAGVPPRSLSPDPRIPTLIRPMLRVSRTEVLDYLSALNQPWREDHTNADLTRWRARLRAEVMPVLEAIRPDAGRKATEFADHLRDVHRVLNDAIDAALQQVEREGDTARFMREAGRQLRRVVLSGMLRKLLLAAGVPGDRMTAKQIGKLVMAVRAREGGERSFSFAGSVRVTVTREWIHVARHSV